MRGTAQNTKTWGCWLSCLVLWVLLETFKGQVNVFGNFCTLQFPPFAPPWVTSETWFSPSLTTKITLHSSTRHCGCWPISRDLGHIHLYFLFPLKVEKTKLELHSEYLYHGNTENNHNKLMTLTHFSQLVVLSCDSSVVCGNISDGAKLQKKNVTAIFDDVPFSGKMGIDNWFLLEMIRYGSIYHH